MTKKNGSAPVEKPALEGELVPAVPVDEPLGMDEIDEEDEADDEDAETFYYCVKAKNGGISFHEDERDPDEVSFDFKLALTFPARPDSLFTDEEQAAFEQLQKEDPRRFGEKTARAFVFQLGDAVMDPREVFMICPADDLVYQADEGEDGEGDQPVPTPTPPPQAPAPPAPAPAAPTGGRLSRLRSRTGASS